MCSVVVVFSSPVSFFYFVPLLSFRPFQMSSSEFHERFESNPLCDFRLGTVATSDHETLLTDFAGDVEDSKSTSGGTLCVFGSHTFVPISWMCKKQTSVSHSSTESEIISLDAGLRMDGILPLDLWDLIVAVLGNTNQSHKER